MAGPSVRARHMKALLARVARLSPGEAAAVRTAFGEASIGLVDEASGVEWLPLDSNLALTRAVDGALDEAAFHRFFRGLLGEAFHQPLFRTLVEGAVALFGLDPGSYCRFLSSGWSLVLRDCGAWETARAGPGRMDLTLLQVPPECVIDEVWPSSVAASLSALVDVARARGAAELIECDRLRRRIRFALCWDAPAA